jgi:hypothetical protein
VEIDSFVFVCGAVKCYPNIPRTASCCNPRQNTSESLLLFRIENIRVFPYQTRAELEACRTVGPLRVKTTLPTIPATLADGLSSVQHKMSVVECETGLAVGARCVILWRKNRPCENRTATAQ